VRFRTHIGNFEIDELRRLNKIFLAGAPCGAVPCLSDLTLATWFMSLNWYARWAKLTSAPAKNYSSTPVMRIPRPPRSLTSLFGANGGEADPEKLYEAALRYFQRKTGW